MRKMLIAMGLLSAVAITSCKDDFKVDAPYKNITFVYAIFNMNDTAHYVRIQKAFLDENKSAITMAQNPDSSFYPTLDVTLQELDNGKIRATYPLNKVDMNLEGFQKDPAGNQGFFTSPNNGYKLKFPVGKTFDPAYQYRLVINNPVTGEKDSSDAIGVVNAYPEKNTSNGNFYIPDFMRAGYTIDFSKTQYKQSYNIIGSTPKYGQWVEGVIRFHVIEKNQATNTTKDVYVDYDFASQITEQFKSFNLSTYNSNFYTFLKNELGAAPANTLRYMDSARVMIYCGSTELYNYQQVNAAQNGGLLGDQIKPIYTNLKGPNVFGMVGSRAINIYENAWITDNTIDSMTVNPITADMGFQRR